MQEILQERLNKCRNLLCQNDDLAVLIEDPIDIFYLTNICLSQGIVLFSKHSFKLIVDGRYLEVCRQSHFEVIELEVFKLGTYLNKAGFKQLVFDSHKTSFHKFSSLKTETEGLNISLHPVASPLEPIRLIKDAYEIQKLKNAAKLNEKGLQHVISHLKEGLSEADLAAELEIFWKKSGGQKTSFAPIIAFGANSSMPHYLSAKHAILASQSHILIDLGVELDHYQSDKTRIVFWKGVNQKIHKIAGIVQTAKDMALSVCKPGTLIKDLDLMARDYITSCGFEEFFNHSLGHGVGLEVHEAPSIKFNSRHANLKLAAGMVITIEPGIYLPGEGGVRLEDTVLITDSGFEIL